VAWKVALPGSGHASPITWGDRIFLATCLPTDQERALVCLRRSDGRQLWRANVLNAPLEDKHALNSYASGTPVTDGRSVYVAFLEVDQHKIPAPNVGTPRMISPGRMVVAAYDYDGRQQWIARPGDFVSAHGFSSCPILYDDLLIVNGDHDGDGYIVAIDSQTGETRWKVARENKTRSYVTPIVRQIGRRTQMVLSGSLSIVSLDPRTGAAHWSIEGPTEQFVASMVFDGHWFFMTCGYPDYHVMAIRPDGSGDVTDTHVAWHSTSARCYVPSPVVLNGYLIVADDRGTCNCFDAQTGQRYWQARLGSGFNASLVHANGLVYLVATDGKTQVIRPGKKLDVVAENDLGEPVSASPAISDGQLLIRTHQSLYCIAAEQTS
jgi:outer membrane protein assembly factor BamB